MPSKVRWRSDEPGREPAYRRSQNIIHDRLANQDGCITFLLVELRALQKRVAKLEQHNAHTAANMVRAAYERVEEVRDELEQRDELSAQP
jgi:hypothetical protein